MVNDGVKLRSTYLGGARVAGFIDKFRASSVSESASRRDYEFLSGLRTLHASRAHQPLFTPTILPSQYSGNQGDMALDAKDRDSDIAPAEGIRLANGMTKLPNGIILDKDGKPWVTLSLGSFMFSNFS